MKALSLHQPWASAIALGAKRIETRSWSTSYRGPLAIHAARTGAAVARIVREGENLTFWGEVLAGKNHLEALPRGAIIATCDLVDVVRTEDVPIVDLYTMPIGQEFLGDFTPGRFAWILRNIRPLPEPVPVRGFQRLFNVTDPWDKNQLGMAWGKK